MASRRNCASADRWLGAKSRLTCLADTAAFHDRAAPTFFPLLPFIVISFVDEQSRPWGTVLPGIPGFMQSPTLDTLRIGRRPPAGDPFAAALREGTPVGLLGIELPTRRRNRINGFVCPRVTHLASP
jgi:predicted pyridoxine 5'-phosphate oxidase superfamily flavin-nucleotide-binding protein